MSKKRAAPWSPPRTVILLEQLWTVDRVKLSEAEGECHTKRRAIHLDPETAPEGHGEVFLHEALHALCRLSGLSESLDDGAEEKVCSSLAPALWAMLRRNKMRFDR